MTRLRCWNLVLLLSALLLAFGVDRCTADSDSENVDLIEKMGKLALQTCLNLKKELKIEKKHKGLCDGFHDMVVEQWEKHIGGMLEGRRLDVPVFERGISDDKSVAQWKAMCDGYIRWELKDGLHLDDRERIRVWNGQFLGMILRINGNNLEWNESNVSFPHQSYLDSLEVRNKLPKTNPELLKQAYAQKAEAMERRKREQAEKSEL